jgi:hypothetical protein
MMPRAAAIFLACLTPAAAAAQSATVALSPEAWVATDSLRSVSYLGRPAIYINRGVALVRGASMENGTLDLDLAASDTTNFLGVAFRAATPRFSNVLFLRPGASGTEESVQYGPAFNSLGVRGRCTTAMAPTRSRRSRATAGSMSGSSWMVRWLGCMSIWRRRRPSSCRG